MEGNDYQRPDAVGKLLSRGRGAGRRRAQLRKLVEARETVLVPGVTDAMGALLVAEAGFETAYVTGAGLANAQNGLPDVGLLDLHDLTDQVRRLAGAVDMPLIADADTGFGGPLSAIRTVRALEHAGAAAVQVEDQEMPKRCGHFDSHTVIPAGHMQAKVAAMVEAREDPNLLVIARTDARSAHDIEDAVDRARAYRDAGADVLFVEAPRSLAELEYVGRELGGFPLVVNVVEGGKTPQLSIVEYEKLGFTIVLYANFLMRHMMRAGQNALRHLRRSGESASIADQMATWEERQQLFRLPEYTAAEAFYDEPWSPPEPPGHGRRRSP
jgi:2-methylisocitrate lyase-like PEP mutase family enzyme